MTILRLLPVLGAILCAAGARAESVTVTVPGTLADAVADRNATELTVAGTVNAADLFWIGENMPALARIDLSAAQIAEYSGDMLHNSTLYRAATIPAGSFAGSALTAVVFPASGEITIGDGAFMDADITVLDIPANIAAIGDGAFAACDMLTRVSVPATVKVGAYAFASCKALTQVTLGTGTDAIAEGQFSNCTALDKVSGAESAVTIGARAFDNCTSLTAFDFGSALTAIGDAAFAHTAITDADLTAARGLRTVGDMAFAHNAGLVKAAFSTSANTVVGKGVFFDCTALTALQLPGRLAKLPDYILKGASKAVIDDLSQFDGLDSIGAYALKDNEAVANLILPSALTHIGTGAMENMTGLQSIDARSLPEAPALGDDVWRGVSQPEVALTIMDTSRDSYENADQWKDFRFNIITGVDDIAADTDAGDKAAITGRFVGSDLVITATGAPLRNIRVYDVSGRLMAALDTDEYEAVLDTNGTDTTVFIVAAILNDGTTGTLKIARR